ncbi:unnamed protein product [Heterobilharzia americana]|nr:unnamed protein product [Heterobilharzia americana]
MRRCNLEYVYIRLTESLLCSLENTKKDGGKVTLVCEKERNPKIVVNISGVEAVYELEPDHSSTYFPLINVKKSVGRFLGNIQYRYKTKATDDSFVRVRENLLEEVENSRQQKIKVQDYQLKSASLIKDKRNTKVKKNLNRNSVSGPALKMAKVSKGKRITKNRTFHQKFLPHWIKILKRRLMEKLGIHLKFHLTQN